MKLFSLSNILHHFVELEVVNETLFAVVTRILEERIQYGEPISHQECITFLQAYLQAQKFD